VGLPTLQNNDDSQLVKLYQLSAQKSKFRGQMVYLSPEYPNFICVRAFRVPELVPVLQLVSQELVPVQEPEPQLVSEPQLAWVFQPACSRMKKQPLTSTTVLMR
jgi:hypothetical protein